ncbi:GDP-L-fucose synthase [archaeon HR01]|nr:GDP-L-fucose synthase [archaeon HR01]
MDIARRRILVTGGVGFIGSKLTIELVRRGATVTVVDKPLKLSSRSFWDLKLNYYTGLWREMGYKLEQVFHPRYTITADDHIVLHVLDLETEPQALENLMREREIDVVFHLAAVFGGRGFVDTRPADCCAGLAINHNVFKAAYRAGVEHVHFASSACVYPPSKNQRGYLLKEEDILSTGEGWYSSDNSYGFVKLMGEMELMSYHIQYGLKGSVARYLTVYGPGEFDESHAIATFIAKAIRREDPFLVWGTGEQERGFTYVDDIVDGTIRAAQVISDASAVNLGWDKRYKIREVVEMVIDIAGYRPKLIFDPQKPMGPFSRALDISRAKTLLGWQPKIDLPEGLYRTYQWASHNIPLLGQVSGGES